LILIQITIGKHGLKLSLLRHNLRIPVIANSDSEGSRTAVRTMANRCPDDAEESERSDAVFKKHLK
jgi:hypothetical protein